MAPRRYTLQRRAETAAATRARIVAAAEDVYRERGVMRTSIAAIAERADVSRGTVVNHFADLDGILEAVLDDVLTKLELPDRSILDGAAGAEDRVRRFVAAMFRFYDRSNAWWRVFDAVGYDLGPLRDREAAFWSSIGGLMVEALGDLAADRVVSATIGALTHPVTYGQFLSAGLSLDETIEAVGTLAADAVRRASSARSG